MESRKDWAPDKKKEAWDWGLSFAIGSQTSSLRHRRLQRGGVTSQGTIATGWQPQGDRMLRAQGEGTKTHDPIQNPYYPSLGSLTPRH